MPRRWQFSKRESSQELPQSLFGPALSTLQALLSYDARQVYGSLKFAFHLQGYQHVVGLYESINM